MGYKSMNECVIDLEKHNQLLRIKDEVDPNLEMALIQRLIYKNKGPAILFENVKGCKYKAISNIFGTLERSKYIFRNELETIKTIIQSKNNPKKIFNSLQTLIDVPFALFHALPIQKFWRNTADTFNEISIEDLPQITSWKNDGGSFITLPIVFTENPLNKGILHSNLGMYRIQLSGNNYQKNKEIGLHYQLHRGIGIHQTNYNALNKPMPVSIYIGGSPALNLAAVMPLPENLPEVVFAGIMNSRHFYYYKQNEFTLAADADFVITGFVYPNEIKPEGPFGDHLGYYSLKHDFPVMRVHKVFAKKNNPIWSFTVVGRPPQEDTSFGALIHEIVGDAIQNEIPGVKAIHAIDAAGVHPVLLAIGSERYTPYLNTNRPQELITQGLHILGSGQLSLAKYLFICNENTQSKINIQDIPNFFSYILERIDFSRDLHFITQTSIDTLDYSGDGLNTGSKVIFAAFDKPLRTLSVDLNIDLNYKNKVVQKGILAIEMPAFTDYKNEKICISQLESIFLNYTNVIQHFPLIILCDNVDFISSNFDNFLWVTFTRSNPSHDIYGLQSFYENKHWGCNGSLIIDARIKPHHAPPLIEDEKTLANVKKMAEKGKILHGLIDI
jgi:4-hydroxy-3-polyprenylbenzoate decarboxylase